MTMPVAEQKSFDTDQVKDDKQIFHLLKDAIDEEGISKSNYLRLFYLVLILLFLIPYWVGLIKIGEWFINLLR
jgi:hypothetical protein